MLFFYPEYLLVLFFCTHLHLQSQLEMLLKHIFWNLSLVLWWSQYSSCTWITPGTDKDKMTKHSLSFFFFPLIKGIENNESLHDKHLLEISFCLVGLLLIRQTMICRLLHSHTDILKETILG